MPKLRAWWFHRQGLDRVSSMGIAEALAQYGWARSVGGSSPYLGLHARLQASRQAVDDAIAKVDIHELPAARSCTYVVPAADYALALKAGVPLADGDMKSARKLGVTDAEVEKLGVAVVDALSKGPLDPDGLKATLGSKVRNLGEEGKKKGVTTTLPLAIGLLQTAGEIRRIPVNGRLDQQRYKYALWRPNPLLKCKLSPDETFTELARRYFEWTGPATVNEFQWFSGLGVKSAKAAIEPLKLVDIGEDARLLPASQADAFDAFKVPREPQYALVGMIDSVLELRRNLRSLTGEEDMETLIPGDRGPVTLGKISDLPSHAILDRGRIIGVWEYDPDAQSIAWKSFRKPDAALKKAVQQVEEFIRKDLGDARSFSLDSPKSRAPRLAALRT